MRATFIFVRRGDDGQPNVIINQLRRKTQKITPIHESEFLSPIQASWGVVMAPRHQLVTPTKLPRRRDADNTSVEIPEANAYFVITPVS